ncbi:unnamed protein product [Lupinus luteus]|uniref:Reverse transcriptase domain-containing protein n=1 Tax=Lupinus luteus TaxID=3873 RepID=A0AAV1VRL9_LUPLU
MLERQERLIQQHANMIEELLQPKADTVSRPERHVEETSFHTHYNGLPIALTLHPTNIDQYDGTTDPQDHLDAFEASMLFHEATDPIMCPNESIRAYLDRFNTEAMKVYTISHEVAVHVLVMGLQQGLFRTELAKYTELIMEVLRSKAQQFNLEETHHIHTHTKPPNTSPLTGDQKTKTS